MPILEESGQKVRKSQYADDGRVSINIFIFPSSRLRDRHEPTTDTSMIEKCHFAVAFRCDLLILGVV